MNLKTLSKALVIKVKQSKPISKKVVKSYVSLFLIFLLGITVTFGWFTEKKTAEINSGDLEFQSASSLRINKDKSASSIIRIDKAVIDEASSLDGRNIYFPLDKSFTTTTGEMRFREANAGDRITGEETGPPYTNNPQMKGHYVYKNFELKGTSGNTPVYIKSYEVKIEEADTPHDASVNATYHDQLAVGHADDNISNPPSTQDIPCANCPIRLAFIADSGEKPVVIDPSAQVVDYVDNSTNAVSLIDENGVPTTVNTYDNNNGWDSFSSYYYGKTPLFTIPGGETMNVTLVVWLEGSLPNCDKYIGKKISVDIDIESNFAEMETITFYDDSQPDNANGQAHWVSNDNPIVACSYEDPYSDETPKRWKTVIMSKVYENLITDPSDSRYVETYTWTCKIPKKAVTNISFYRLSRDNNDEQGTIYNAWHTTTYIDSWLTASDIPNNWYISSSNIPDGWQMSSSNKLQVSRQMTDTNGNTYNALVYTAVHGNGYSVTNTTSKRLAPCVGYWDYSGGSGGGSSGGGSGGGSSGGGTSYSTCNVGVYLNTGAKSWIEQNASNGSVMHCTTQSGEDFILSHTGTNYFTGSKSLTVGDSISGFYLKHSGGATSNIKVGSIFEVPNKQSQNVTYTVDNDDKAQVTS